MGILAAGVKLAGGAAMTSGRGPNPSLPAKGPCSQAGVASPPSLGFVSAHAALVVACIFAVLGIAAAGFAAWPALRERKAAPLAHVLLACAIALLVIGIAGGFYLVLGRPDLAERTLAAPGADGVPGLIAALSRRMRDRPRDITGWTLLGRGYLSLDDPSQAAIAFRNAAELATPAQKPELLSAYGEALTVSAGTVTPEAEAAFAAALAGNPKDQAARFYLGQAYADRHQPERALALWRSLLADAPANAPWRPALIGKMVILQSQATGAPNISAMVAGLAARLRRTNPDDLDGWERLVRAYTVLGQKDRALSALASARGAMRGQPKALAALDAEAQSLGIGK
jgi:cytochrome c-type biogenesis protein CcmH